MTRRLAHKLESQWRSQDVLQSEEKATFDEFLLSQRVLSGLRKAGFIRPSPIQLRAIPLGLCGFDMVVQAKSGTGKTCVFSVLALQAINTARNAVQVLILAPTREIAVQSCDTVRCLGCDTPGLEVYAFIGGLSVREDVRKLARCHVAVGTLGRLLQLVEQGQLCLDGVRLLVLDEADQLLGESFREGLRQLWVKLPARFQIVATSATYPPEVARTLEQELLHDPVVVRLGDGTPSLLGVSQWYCVAEGADEAAWFPRKVRALECVLRRLPFSQCLVFLNSQARAQSLAERLTHAGFAAQLLSGAQDQEQRIRALVQLKAFRCRILVSTDLGARGIDAERVNLVVHFDVARDLETHLHRTGRAGRYGTAGQAVTLVTGRTELKQLRELCSSLDLQIKPLPGFPSLDDGSSECWVNGGVEAKRISKEMCTQAMESSLDMVGMPRTEDAGPSEGGVLQLTGIESSHLEPGLNESNLLEPAMTESSQLQPVTTESTALKQVIAESDLLQSAHIESDELCLATTETHCLQQTMTEGALLQPLMSESAQVQPTMTERDCLQPNGVESGLLRPTMGPLLTFEEALRGKRAGPPVRPILPWPPNPSLGQDLAVRIAEEKEAFCRTYNITLKPGRIMGLATRLSSDGSCKLHSCSEAGTQNLHGKTEVGEDGCALQSYPDQSKRQERQLGGIVAEEAGEANVVLKQSTNARQCTLQTQQETSGFALASEVMGTKRAGIKELPKASTPPLQVRSINLESESAVLREAQGKENVFKSSSGERTGNLGWTQAMENKGHVGNRSLREQGSMFSESQLDEKEKGKSKSSDRCSLQLKPNIAAAELRPGKMRWRKNVSYQDQQRLKSTSSEEADGEDNVVACARWSRRLEQQPPSRKPACSPRSSAPPVMPHLSLAGGDSNLPQTHPATEEGLCFECAQKCDNIRAACYSGRHLKRTVMADTWFPSWTHLQPNAATALMDWSRNWFRWHQWYIRKMLETSGRY